MESRELDKVWKSLQASALDVALSGDPDAAEKWLDQANALIRREIFRGRWQHCVERGRLVGAARAMMQPSSSANSSHSHPVYDSLMELGSGIATIVHHCHLETAAQKLSWVATNTNVDASLRWIAWIWLSAASAVLGQLDEAKTAASTARTIAGQLDTYAQSVSQAIRAAVEFLRGNFDEPRNWLFDSISRLEQIDCQREVSQAWLFYGKVMLAAHCERDALQVLGQAMDADSTWAPPAVQLARRALIAGQLKQAESVLQTARQFGADSPELTQTAQLVVAISQGQLPLAAAQGLLLLRERPLTAHVLTELVEYVEDRTNFNVLRVALGWELAACGYIVEPAKLFKPLLEGADEAPTVTASAREGMATLISGQSRALSPLGFLCDYGRFDIIEDLEDAAPDQFNANVFWSRRAVIAGRLEEAEEILEAISEASEPGGTGEIARERRLLASIRSGETPQSVAAEYLWIRQRPLTDIVVDQVRELNNEHRSYLVLREIMAWDLALPKFDSAANQLFRELAEELDLTVESQDSIRQGLEFLRRNDRSAGRAGLSTTDKDTSRSELSQFVTERQPWPSVLDHHSLLFTGHISEIPPDVLSWTEILSFGKGDILQHQGQAGWLLAFLEEGEVIARRTRGESQEIGIIERNSLFGEAGAIWGLPNTTMVEATAPTIARTLSREVILRQVRLANEAGTALLKTLRGWYMDVVFRICPLFTNENGTNRTKMTENSTSEIFHHGERLATQGKPSALYVIVSGIAQVNLDINRSWRTLGYLCPGDVIGDIIPSPVTVVAKGTVSVLSIDRERILRISAKASETLNRRSKLTRQIITEVITSVKGKKP